MAYKLNVKCPACGSRDFVIMCDMTVEMPMEYYHRLNKKKIRSKDFKLWGVNWNDADFICKSCGCTVGPHTGIKFADQSGAEYADAGVFMSAT